MTTAPTTAPSTRRLLLAGLLAGPIYTATALSQVITRDGFDLTRHPLSLLSVGQLGWIQIGNFVLAGSLAIAFAMGLRRVIRDGRGSTWGPLLIGIYGLGLIAGGIFVPDPALGFPPGTPDGIPAVWSWHSTAHAFAPPIAFTALVIACVVFARRFAQDGERAWATYTVMTAVVALLLSAFPSPEGMSVRLAIAVVLGWAWVSAFALRLLKDSAIETESVNARAEATA